jgi:multidrug resistance efflux pump
MTSFCLLVSGCVARADPSNDPRDRVADGRPHPKVVLASTGRVEGAGDTVELAAGMDGVIGGIDVVEGQSVSAGQTVAHLDREDVIATVAVTRAALARAKAVRAQLVRGGREEVRASAAATRAAAESQWVEAKARYDRTKQLYAERVASGAELDQVTKDVEAADAAVRKARSDELTAAAAPLPEEIARADAEVWQAHAALDAALSQASKIRIKTPLSGTVVKILLHQGEAVSTVNPQAIMWIADLSHMTIRAEVDERDVSKVRVGQCVLATAETWGQRQLSGKVDAIGLSMGRKHVRSGDPAEKADRDVLEVIVALEPAAPLPPLGLRVTARFME